MRGVLYVDDVTSFLVETIQMTSHSICIYTVDKNTLTVI